MTDPTGGVEGYRLSPQQRYLWKLRTGAESGAFDATCTVAVEGQLDPAMLQAAIDRVVARHEILRTGFRCLPGATLPVQVIADSVGVPVQAAPNGAAAPTASARALETGPLLSVSLERREDGAELRLRLPSLCADVVGVRNLIGELGRAYRSVVEGVELDDEPMQYADLSEWQNELLEDSAAAQSFAVSPADAAVDLGGDLVVGDPDGMPPVYAPSAARRAVDAGVAAAIEQVAERHRTTVGSVLLTAWLVLLHRMTGREEFVVGVVGDGRSYEGLDTALGLFARDLPLPVRVVGSDDFAKHVEDVVAAHGSLLERQEYFAWERAAPATADGVTPPYFGASFGFEERAQRVEAAGVTFSVRDLRARSQRSDLRLVGIRDDAGLRVELEYDSGRIDPATAEQWLSHYCVLLAAAVADSERAVAALPLLDDAARRGLLVDFNQTVAAVDDDRCIHELIEHHATATPSATAVEAVDGALTYAELEVQSNRLAHHLRGLGVKPDELVGLCTERSASMVVGLLGILKAGAAYLPLDPSYPADRLAFMLEDSRVRVVVTLAAQEGVLSAALANHEAGLVRLDADAEVLAGESHQRPEPAASPADLCYVIYTSGSTGKPKGVEILHRNLVHSTTARQATYDEPPGRYLLLSSYAFDSSVVGLFWTLCEGGTLVLPGGGEERDLHAITGLIERHAVTHTLALPSLYSLVLRETAPEKLASLRCVIVAGETCTRELVELHGEHLPGVALWNEYGPTEGTVWSSVHRCQPGRPGRRVPIGRPPRNVQVYLLDARQQPVPVGVPGELYIGGAGLARGYLRRPELTAERFVANHLDGTPGDRLYRTGDLARWRADGEIDFLGRVDYQVKVRGYRIELEEVEDALSQCAGVREVAVAAREDTPGDVRLVGYVVLDGDASTTDLATKLLAALPEYMVPTVWVVLDALPLNPNGKVDRKALPSPAADAAGERPPYAAPRTSVEEVLAEIWADVLDVEQVGVDDNFFQLGGHSLLVTQLVFRLRDTFQVELPLRVAFEAPTLGGLAEALIADPDRKVCVERAAELLAQVAQLSEDEVDAMLEDDATPSGEDSS